MEGNLLLISYGAIFVCFTMLVYSVIKLLKTEYTSYEDRAVNAFGHKLSQIYIFMEPDRFYRLCALAAVIGFLLGLTIAGGRLIAGTMLGGMIASLGFIIPWVVVNIMLQKRLEMLDEQLPDGLDMLSSSVKAGVTLSEAIGRCAERVPPPLQQEFRVIKQEQRLGIGLVDALGHWAERTGLPDIKLVAVTSEIALKLGGSISDNYDTLATLIRQRHAFKREIKSLTAEGRLQAIFMALLPFIVLVLMTLIDSERMIPFLKSPFGMVILVLLVIMQVSAYFWIKKITSIEF